MLLAAVISLAPPIFPLTIPSIMRGYGLVGHAPNNVRWTADGQSVNFSWAKADGTQNPATHAYKVKRDGTGLALGTVEQSSPQPEPAPSAPQRVYSSLGDLYLYDSKTNETKRLTNTPEDESDPVLSKDGKSVLFVTGLNVYRLDIADGTRTQLTDVKSGDLVAP